MLERSAYAESEYHLTQALRALRRKARGAERRRQELELRSALTALEMGRHGPASVPAARCAHKAQALCVGLEIDDGVARALMLSARVLFANGKLRATWRMLAPLRAYMDSIRDPYLRASVLTQAGNLMSSLGRLDEAEGLQDRAMAAYAEAREHPAGALTTDPLAHLLITRAGNDWLRGRAAASRRWVDAAIAETERLGHPFSRAMIRVLSASLALRQGDQARFAELSEEGRRQAAAIGSNWLMSMADVFIPLADESLAPAKRAQRLQAALTVHPGTWLYRSVPMSELADLLASAGRPDDALQAMNEAVTEAKRRDLCLAPEILRRRGELLARLGRTVEAEADHRRGLRAARREGAFGLELRCVLSLARLLSANGREVAARRALESVLARLPADVDVPERAEAASMSAALGRPPVSP
jgi:tetratricopeptide (TPR) repeat protein